MKELESLISSWADATLADKTDEANAKAMEVLCLAAEEAIKHPTPSILLQQEADDFESQGRWIEAEAVRRKLLSLDETTQNLGALAKAQMDLAALLRLLGRREEASRFATAATAVARRAEMFPILVMALECESWCALELDDFSGALALASEAVTIIEPGKLYDSMRARSRTHRARCRVACGETSQAEADLAASWEWLQAHPATWPLPGNTATLANWWEVKGQLEQQQSHTASAQVATAQAVEYRRKLESPYAQCALARVLDQLDKIAGATGDLETAEQAKNEAGAIRERLKLPPQR